MGGLLILTSVAISVLLWMDLRNPYVWACLLVTAGFGLIGFLDDYDKVRKAHHAGLSGKTRLALEFLIAGAATWLMVRSSGTGLHLPFVKETVIDLGYFYIFFGAFVIVAFGNAVNLTDGLDGLATMPVIIASIAFLLITYLVGNVKFATYLGIPHVPGAGDLTVLLLAIIGAGLAFLWFNAPPAAVFMGDTGSLALGGALGAVAVATHHEFVLAIVGGIFVVEALSRRDPGRGLQAHRQARLPDGADPPPFRAARLVRADRRDPLLDHQLRARAGGPFDPQAAGDHRQGLRREEIRGLRACEVRAGDGRGVACERRRGDRVGREGGGAGRRLPARAHGSTTSTKPTSRNSTASSSLPASPSTATRSPQRARDAGVEIIGDIELFARARPELPPHKVVGITGTNGKSTTTALVHHILKTAGVPTTMGGNIGLPILAQDPLPEGGVYVLELSSYQIDLTRSLDCEVAVLLNITPDHLDRYESFEGYAASKMRLLDMQSQGQNSFIGTDANMSALDLLSEQREWPTLQGPHNRQNCWAAILTCRGNVH